MSTHSDNTAQPGKLHANCMDDKLGDSVLLHVAHWNCSCETARGSPVLLAPLAAAAAGRGSLLAAGFIIWAVSGWFACHAGRIRVISPRGLPLPCFHTKCASILPELFALGCLSAVGLSGQPVSLVFV